MPTPRASSRSRSRSRSASGESPAPASIPARGEAVAPDMSRHLIGLSSVMRLRMSRGLLERGHDLRPSTAQVIPNLPPEGLRMTELASRLRLTLQRAGQLVSELEEVGYLERVSDPADGRAKRVVYTRRGRALIRDIEEITRETTELFAAALGEDRYRRLCAWLAELDVAINGADAPVRVVGAGYEGAAL